MIALVRREPPLNSQPPVGPAMPGGREPSPGRRWQRVHQVPERGHPFHPERPLRFTTQMVVAFAVLAITCARIMTTMVISSDGFRALLIGGLITATAPLITMAAMLIIGLPIRLIPTVRRWWIANGEISVAGIVLGCIAIIASYARGHQEEGQADGLAYSAWVPDYPWLLAGWLLMSFFLTHAWFPPRWRRSEAARADS